MARVGWGVLGLAALPLSMVACLNVLFMGGEDGWSCFSVRRRRRPSTERRSTEVPIPTLIVDGSKAAGGGGGGAGPLFKLNSPSHFGGKLWTN